MMQKFFVNVKAKYLESTNLMFKHDFVGKKKQEEKRKNNIKILSHTIVTVAWHSFS